MEEENRDLQAQSQRPLKLLFGPEDVSPLSQEVLEFYLLVGYSHLDVETCWVHPTFMWVSFSVAGDIIFKKSIPKLTIYLKEHC